MEMGDLIERTKRQLADLTGLKPVGVTGVFQDNGSWHLRLEMLEMSRIPPASDIIGEYDVFLDGDGRLLRFERKRSRIRGQPVEVGVGEGG